MLGIFYMEGKSVPENKLLAKKYFEQVIANNDNVNAVKISTNKLKQLQ
jgi:TPR repeat protein